MTDEKEKPYDPKRYTGEYFRDPEFETEFSTANNMYRTKSLFYERTLPHEREYVKYTLKRFPWKGYQSLYQLYMAMEDPSEYKFANAYFDSWEHWMAIVECKWFTEHIFNWRRELEVKIRAKALFQILQEAEHGKKSFEASKYVLDGKWQVEGHSLKRGRPKKKDIIKATAEELNREASDKERLGLN